MKLALVSCLAVSVFVAACVDPAERVDVSDQAIVGGVSANVGDYPTAVAIVSRGLCTGTLIAPDVVLTAAHCLLPSLLGFSSQEEVTAGTQVVFDTDDIRGGGGFQVKAAVTMPHPAFTTSTIGDNDVGLIWLAQAVTDRAPTPINRFYDDAAPGVVVTQVGYGVSAPGDQGTAGKLRMVQSKQTTACQPYGAGSDSNLLCFSQSDGTGKCEGDSGGPSYMTIGGIQRVVGITSFGDQNCAQFGADTRVDAELDFLFEQVPSLQCQPDGVCNDLCGKGGLPVDDDCPTCADDSDCGDSNLACVDGLCRARPGTPGGLGSSCASSDECDSGICGGGPDGNRCTDLCTLDGNECPDGFDCIAAGGDAFACWPGADGGGGGCSVTTTTPRRTAGSFGLWLLLGLALARRRRRRA